MQRKRSHVSRSTTLTAGLESRPWIKWHVKNLFAKLDAGTRKQVVQRARILGLLVTER